MQSNQKKRTQEGLIEELERWTTAKGRDDRTKYCLYLLTYLTSESEFVESKKINKELKEINENIKDMSKTFSSPVAGAYEDSFLHSIIEYETANGKRYNPDSTIIPEVGEQKTKYKIMDNYFTRIKKYFEKNQEKVNKRRTAISEQKKNWYHLIDQYFKRRNSDQRDEAYKWNILPTLKDSISKESITPQTIKACIQHLDKNKQNRVSFRGNFSDLMYLAEKYPKELSILFEKLLYGPENIATKINNFITQCALLETNHKPRLGTPMFGYIFACLDPDKYPIYKGEILSTALKSIYSQYESKERDKSIGSKYQLFCEICDETIKEFQKLNTKAQYNIGYSALDAQDFMYFITTHKSMNSHSTNIQSISHPHNLILYGVPGTGKTYHTKTHCIAIIENKDIEEIKKEGRNMINGKYEEYQEQIVFTTFHQSYGYEDFIEGIKSEVKENQLHYTIEDGVLKRIAQKAKNNKEKNYVLIIDEINRGNISKIFGELITLLEPDKRTGGNEELTLQLPYSKSAFGLPKNLYIIGTMNTADKSIALMDIALRRRFEFKEIEPNSEVLEGIKIEGINLKKLFETINKRIELLYDRDHRIGHAYFIDLKREPNLHKLNDIMLHKIIPLLQEYFYDDREKIQIVLGDHKDQNCKKEEDKIIKYEKQDLKSTIGFEYEGLEEGKQSFSINTKTEVTENSYIGIYQSTLNA